MHSAAIPPRAGTPASDASTPCRPLQSWAANIRSSIDRAQRIRNAPRSSRTTDGEVWTDADKDAAADMAAGQDSWAAPCRRCRCGTQARRRADRQACTERNSLARRAWRADTQAYTARCNKLARRAHKATAPDSKPPGRTAAVQKHDDESQWINPPSPSRYIQHQHMLQSVLCAPRRSFHTELNGDGAFFQATSLFPAPPPCPWRFPAHTDQKKLRDEQNKTVRISVHSGLKSVPFFQESHTLETVFPPHSRKNRPQRHAAIPVLLPVEALQRPLAY